VSGLKYVLNKNMDLVAPFLTVFHPGTAMPSRLNYVPYKAP